MIDGIPLPARDGPFEAGFWRALERGELAHQNCADCGVWHFPPRWRCHCGQPLAYRAVSGNARLWSWTVIHPPVLPAFAPFAPYPVAIAELAEAPGLRMVGPLVQTAGDPINHVDPSRLTIGMPLQACIVELAEGTPWPAWKI
ncbi:hypothetical protein MB02_00140 [Croceicoccus estronivorus]|uniref:Zn-ribbon domain-containing OB-fold protein n=1 Tax=Croceicoccus estronivorus TaxID=1172626 RepID=UPI0008344E86|nr:OB-fold domain-containing protein [Croceicoccus estronivorus]OCC25146.1 hypothetical protein MB02_00140 [Croceicoccus estronivorus]